MLKALGVFTWYALPTIDEYKQWTKLAKLKMKICRQVGQRMSLQKHAHLQTFPEL